MNPWLTLPKEVPFVLDGDRPLLDAFNQKAGENARIETALMPEPYVGLPDAPVILLVLNPGVSDGDFPLHRQPEFRDRIRQCHRHDQVPFPNYYLDPAVTGPGAKWIARITRPLLEEFGARAVAAGVTLLEYFPYHSRRFAHHRLRVPSQAYTFDLVRSAVRRQAVVFITRGRPIWEDAVTELRDYPRVFRTQSTQNVVISPRNCPEGYEAARAALRSAAA